MFLYQSVLNQKPLFKKYLNGLSIKMDFTFLIIISWE